MIKISYGASRSDDTFEYIITFRKPMTVGEFIEEWITKKPDEWGYFGIHDNKSIFGNPKCEYSKGKIIADPIPDEYLNAEIDAVSGSGGWSRSDFKFYVERRERMSDMTIQNAIHCMKAIICEAVCEECDYYGKTGTDHCEADAVRMAIKALEEQPHWILCSERLPENNVPVNITWINRKPEFYYAEIKDVPFTATGVYFKGKWYWYSSTVEDYLAEYGRAEWDEIEEAMHNSIEVVAWMPLPEPYGGSDAK